MKMIEDAEYSRLKALEHPPASAPYRIEKTAGGGRVIAGPAGTTKPLPGLAADLDALVVGLNQAWAYGYAAGRALRNEQPKGATKRG